jgi:O-phospho-L-seryl-tRNASec:L-selenocysteinyl-tRNA synthase
MDDEQLLELASGLVNKAYISHGAAMMRQRTSAFKSLLAQRRMPDEGWDELTIESFLHDLAAMESNNAMDGVGAGEREGRVLCPMVWRRHYGFSHGIGRSGDLLAQQPKASGGSLLQALGNKLVLDVIRSSGVPCCKEAIVFPCATGMTLTLVLLALKAQRPEARYVLWPRIDQKTCLKCIYAAGLEPYVIENKLVGDALTTDLDALDAAIQLLTPDEIVAVLSTTSCFAPRLPDKIIPIAALCKTAAVPHVVNNAYGVTLRKVMNHIQEASLIGRVDAFVQSTDKNFCVPVGGAVVASANADFVQLVAKRYPGRASAAPNTDVLITLLHLGKAGWKALLVQREEVFAYLRERMLAFAASKQERILDTSANVVSLAMTVNSLGDRAGALGAALFVRHVTGARINRNRQEKLTKIEANEFVNYGQHYSAYPHSYLNVAAGIGMSRDDVVVLLERLQRAWADVTSVKPSAQ